MALPVKGSRRISVDGLDFLWRLRRRPTYTQALGGDFNVAIGLASGEGSTLMVKIQGPRPDAWIQEQQPYVVTPGQVADAIRKAKRLGWVPESPGSAFAIDLGV